MDKKENLSAEGYKDRAKFYAMNTFILGVALCLGAYSTYSGVNGLTAEVVDTSGLSPEIVKMRDLFNTVVGGATSIVSSIIGGVGAKNAISDYFSYKKAKKEEMKNDSMEM